MIQQKKIKKWKKRSRIKSHIKRIWIMEKSRYLLIVSIIMLLSAIRLYMFPNNVSDNIYVENIIMVISWYIIPFVIILVDYAHRKDVRNGLWVSVMEKCFIEEDYKKFLAIKKCIETFVVVEDGKMECDIITKINVIEASIERDKTQSILTPISVTTLLALFFENNTLNLNIFFNLFISLGILISMAELLYQLPKNAFIKKVTASIREEIDMECTEETGDEE